MHLNIKLDRFNPADFGKSGTIAICIYCAKTTEYNICCDEYDGLFEVTSETVIALCEEYDFRVNQILAAVKAVKAFEAKAGK